MFINLKIEILMEKCAPQYVCVFLIVLCYYSIRVDPTCIPYKNIMLQSALDAVYHKAMG